MVKVDRDAQHSPSSQPLLAQPAVGELELAVCVPTQARGVHAPRGIVVSHLPLDSTTELRSCKAR